MGLAHLEDLEDLENLENLENLERHVVRSRLSLQPLSPESALAPGPGWPWAHPGLGSRSGSVQLLGPVPKVPFHLPECRRW